MKALVLGKEPPHCHAKRVLKLKASAPIGMNNPFEPLNIEESSVAVAQLIANWLWQAGFSCMLWFI
jgi:hypothetical protein